MDIIWDGVTTLDGYKESIVNARVRLADAAKAADWPAVFSILLEHPEFANSCRLAGKSFYTPLHQAAYAGAPVEVTNKLIDLGAWRTIQNSRGERAIDVAERMGHYHLREALPQC